MADITFQGKFHAVSTSLTIDYLAIHNVLYQWARYYDSKDWTLLLRILAPSIRLDFTTLQGELHDGITPEGFADKVKGMIGDERIKTQHFLGGVEILPCEDGLQVTQQLRVAHQRYTDEKMTEVVNKGHGHGFTVFTFTKMDGEWKIKGCKPNLEWTEYDLFGTLKGDD